MSEVGTRGRAARLVASEAPAEHAKAANIYLYLEAGTAPDGARLFELLGE